MMTKVIASNFKVITMTMCIAAVMLLLLSGGSMVTVLASAACPADNTNYAVTTSETISFCDITGGRIDVDMGTCIGCVLIIESNSITQTAHTSPYVNIGKFPPSGSITVKNNTVSTLNLFIRINVGFNVDSGTLLVESNQIEVRMLTFLSGYDLVQIDPHSGVAGLAGTTSIRMASNIVTFTGVSNALCEFRMLELGANFMSQTVTFTIEDNKEILTDALTSTNGISSSTAYRTAGSLYMKIILINIAALVASSNYPTILVQRNSIVYAPSTDAKRPRVWPQLVALHDQPTSINPITIIDNTVTMDCTYGSVASIEATILSINAHAMSGALRIENNVVEISNFGGLLHEIEMFVLYIPSGTVTLNGASTISNNSQYIKKVSSAAATTAIPQMSTGIVGNNYVEVELVIGTGATLLITNNTNEVHDVVFWRRSATYSGVPHMSVALIFVKTLTTQSGATLNVSFNTLASDVHYKGITADDGATFTSGDPSMDAEHAYIGAKKITSTTSNIHVVQNTMNVSVISFLNSQSCAATMSDTTSLTGTTVNISGNTMMATHDNITGTTTTAVLYSTILLNLDASTTVLLNANAVVVSDTSLLDSTVGVHINTAGLTTVATSSLSISDNRVNHTFSRATRTLAALLSLASSTTCTLGGLVHLVTNTMYVTPSTAGDTNYAFVDAIPPSDVPMSRIHGVFMNTTLTVGSGGVLNVSGMHMSVVSDTPRPALAATIMTVADAATVSGVVSASTCTVDVSTPVYCRLRGELAVGGLRFSSGITLEGVDGAVTLNHSTFALKAIDDTAVASPTGTETTCSNLGTVTTFAMHLASLTHTGSGSGSATCSHNTISTQLGERTFLRGVTQLASITMGAGTMRVTVEYNTLTTTTASGLATTNTATMATQYGITPTTLCGGTTSGVVHLQLAAATVMTAGNPVAAVRWNTVTIDATEESWGTCSVLNVAFSSTAATSSLVDITNNILQLATSASDSLTTAPKIVSLSGTITPTPSVDFAVIRDNSFHRTMITVPTSTPLGGPFTPALLAPVTITTTAGSALQWWACRNTIGLFRSDGGSNATRYLRTYLDVLRTCQYNPIQVVPSHCGTETPSISLSLPSTKTKTQPETQSETHSMTVTRRQTSTRTLRLKAPAAPRLAPLSSPPVLASSSAALGGATLTASEGAASLQVLVIITTMSCRTQDVAGTSRSEGGGSSLLSPVSIPGLGPSREMVGSLILVTAIILGYFAITHFIFAIVECCSDDNIVIERLWKARLYTLYPRLPIIAASLLMPGIIFDGASLLYGDTSGVAAWWERLLGAVAIILSGMLVLYHVAVGRLARPYILDALVTRGKETSHTPSSSNRVPSHTSEAGGPCPLVPPSKNDDHEMKKRASVVFDTSEQSEQVDDDIVSDEEAPPIQRDDDDGGHSSVSVDNDDSLPPQDTASDEQHPQAQVLSDSIDEDYIISDTNDDDDDQPPRSTKLIIEVWISRFTTEERSIVPKAIRAPLLPPGRWGSQVGRTLYCIVTSLRPAAAPHVAAHSVGRVFLIGMLAAANPQSKYGCTVVESVLAAICFIHGILVLSLRIFRISALTVLQGLQSFVLGLVAIIPYMGGDIEEIGAGLTYAMIALIVVEIACSIIVLGLEMWLERRSHKQTSTMDNLQNIALD